MAVKVNTGHLLRLGSVTGTGVDGWREYGIIENGGVKGEGVSMSV